MALALAGILFAAGAWTLVPGVTGVYHDDAIYVITAKALAQGDGYRLINLPGAPRQTKYPILYPLLLAAVWKVQPEFPDTVVLMQYLTLMLGAAAVGLSYLFLVRFAYCTRRAAACVGLLCATSPEIAYFSTITMAEMPFLLSTIVALWRVELAALAAPRPRQALLTGLALAMPFLCRTVGATIILGGIAVLAARRRPIAWVALGALVPTGAWILWASGAWGMFTTGSASGYYTDYGGAWIGSAGSSLGSIAGFNAVSLLVATPMSALFGLTQVLTPPHVMLVPPLLLLGGLTWAAIAVDANRQRPLAWILAAYAVTTVFWPWPPGRFIVPLYPFLAAYLWRSVRTGLTAILGVVSARMVVVMATAGCLVAMTSGLAVLAAWARAGREAGYPTLPAPSAPFTWQSFDSLFSWLRDRPEGDAVVAGGLDTMLFLYTGHQSVRPFPHRPDALFYGAARPPTGTARELRDFLRHENIRYLVESPMYLFAEEEPFAIVVRELREAHPGLLKEVYRGQDRRFAVYEVVR